MVRERTSARGFLDALIIPPVEAGPGLNVSSRFPAQGRLEVDVGCGRGRFLLAHASNHPDTNFLGIDRVLLRLRKIDRRACQAGLANIRLIQGDAIRVIEDTLPPLSVSVFYIFFPDPWPKRRHHCHRLISKTFIERIYTTLLESGVIHLCTDHDDYFLVMRKLFMADARFSEVPPFIPPTEEETDFEILFKNQDRTAKRCSFMKQTVPATES
jgi:tRNA (guanine-N7-)-methyltransferase